MARDCWGFRPCGSQWGVRVAGHPGGGDLALCSWGSPHRGPAEEALLSHGSQQWGKKCISLKKQQPQLSLRQPCGRS